MTESPNTGLIYEGEKSERGRVPLTGVSVRAEIIRSLHRVRVRQRYENRETRPIEANYVFPLEEGSAVCSFSVTIDEKRIEGRVLPRDRAFDHYDDAMERGDGAFLLDQERPNIFTASVGNVLPGQSVEIELGYVAELPREGKSYRLAIPTTISPRYVPESHRDFEGMNDAERIHPPLSVDELPYRLDLEVTANLLSPIRSIESPSHKIHARIDGNSVLVRLAGDEGALDRDFVLLLTPAEAEEAVSCLASDEQGHRFAMLSFAPRIEVRRKPVDITFLVDCSGSMMGPSIEEARRTLLLCVQSLEAGDRFDIVRFGHSHRSLFGESRAYDDESLDRAREHAQTMRADLGGTEIFEPLEKILLRPGAEGLCRRIVLITDGQVTDEDLIIALASKHRPDTRIFAFGIGPGSSEFLVRGVARASGGVAEFVYPGETIEDKVLRHFDRMTRSCAEELTLSWDGLETSAVYPRELPPLAPGEELTVLARVHAGTTGRATLSGEVDGREFSQSVEFSEKPSAGLDPSALPVLWARRRIRDLEENDRLSARKGGPEDGRRGKTERELVRLGKRYGLVSSATSYVAIEKRDEAERPRERAELRRVPARLTTGWGGISAVRMMHSVFTHGQGAFLMLDAEGLSPPGLKGSAGAARKSLLGTRSRSEASIDALVERSALHRSAFWDSFHSQNADGSWDLDDLELLEGSELAASLSELREAAGRLGHPDGERILATLMMLSVLEKRVHDRNRLEPTFRPAVRKARRWLRRATKKLSPPDRHASWEAWVETFTAAAS